MARHLLAVLSRPAVTSLYTPAVQRKRRDVRAGTPLESRAPADAAAASLCRPGRWAMG